MIATAATSWELTVSSTKHIFEPQGNLYDDQHHSEADQNYWNFCNSGAATVVLYYWNTSVASWSADHFQEPYGPHIQTTGNYWAPSDTGTSSDTSDGYPASARSYVMYIAERVAPPSYPAGSPGVENFSTYPTQGATLPDTRDALNWEASGHSSTGWQNYFFAVSNPTESQLHADIVNDVYSLDNPVIAALNTSYLPNWSASVPHVITVVGYNDTNSTYQYIDTCSKACGGDTDLNAHVWTISQHQLYLAIHAFGTGIIW